MRYYRADKTRGAVRVATFEAEEVGGVRDDEAPSGPARDGFRIAVVARLDCPKQRFIFSLLDFSHLRMRQCLCEAPDPARQRGFITVGNVRSTGL